MMLESLLAEVSKLSKIHRVAGGLVEFALSLEPNSELKSEHGRYVVRPKNFVTFSVHSSRTNNLTVTMRGNPSEFEHTAELLVKKDQNGYSVFRLEEIGQLAAAANHIKRAHTLFDRGRTRPIKAVKTVEI
ncbi:MAG: hypothetical protein KDK75_15515 [Alphaproteobacteria bacterium]|nr:hypothetical protein [Alphaproteobacteria bacterium]